MPLFDCPPGTHARLLEFAFSVALILALGWSCLMFAIGTLISASPDRLLDAAWIHGRIKTRILLPEERPTIRDRTLALGMTVPVGLVCLHLLVKLYELLNGPHSGCPLPF